MSVLSDLTLEINNTLPTGVDHQITAAKVRQVLTDMATQIIASQAITGGGGGGGSGVAERYLTSSTTANPGDICYCNTAAGGFTITLPANPIVGTGVGFRDAESSWAASNLIVFPGSNKIENQTGNLVCDVTNGNFDLVWSGTAAGWQLIPAITFASGSGGSSGAVGGAGASYYHINANQAVVAGGIYYCDTSGGSFTVTIPTGPAIGDGISFRDPVGGWDVSNLILNPGANPINSNAGNFVVDQADINFDLIWRGQPIGWQVEVPVSEAVRSSGGLERVRAIQTLSGLGQSVTATSGTGAITWNPSDKVANIVLSGGNLTATATGTVSGGVRATTPGQAGRYFEITWSTAVTNGGIGLVTAGRSLSAYPGDPNGIGFFASGYVEWPSSGSGNTIGTTWASGDVMGVLLGASNCVLFKNGTSIYTVNALPSGPLYPELWLINASEAATANFGATTLAHLPSGATAWNGTQGTTSTATWNPSDQSGLVLSNGNLTATGSSGGGQGRGTRAGSNGKYFELHIDAGGTAGGMYVGLANSSQSLAAAYAGNPNGISYFNNGYAEWPGGSGSGPNYATGDTIGIRLLSSNAEFYKNGTLVFTTGGIPAGSVYPMIGLYGPTAAVTADFGATTFVSLPSGATAWNT